MFYFILFFLFILGLILGSFLNVVIQRQFLAEDWVKGRSRCDYCRHQIAWYDNIPLLSYLILGGKCRYCGKKICFTHPLMEILTAFLLSWWYWCFSFIFTLPSSFKVFQAIFWLVIGVILLAIFVIDLKYLIIPDILIFLFLILVIIYRLYLGFYGLMQWSDVLDSLVISFILTSSFYFLYWITKERGLGFGDVKFSFPLGLLLGWPKILIAIYSAFILGSLAGLAILIIKKKKLKNHRIPFGPFLIMGALIGLVFGEKLFQIIFLFNF